MTFDVIVREPVQLPLVRDFDFANVVLNVAAELQADLGNLVGEPAHGLAGSGVFVDSAEPVLEQYAVDIMFGHGICITQIDLAKGLVDVVVQSERDGFGRDRLGKFLCLIADLRLGMDLEQYPDFVAGDGEVELRLIVQLQGIIGSARPLDGEKSGDETPLFGDMPLSPGIEVGGAFQSHPGM